MQNFSKEKLPYAVFSKIILSNYRYMEKKRVQIKRRENIAGTK
jgi:hypothetical protein